MQITSVITGLGLITSALGALEGGSNMGTSGGYEYGYGNSKVTTVGSTTTGIASSMATDLTTVVQVTLSSEVVETLPGTTIKSEDKSSETVSSAVVTETSASLVGTTLSSESLASTTGAVISTETNEAIGGTSSSTSNESDVTVRITSTVTLSGVASTVIRTLVPTTTQAEGFEEPIVTDTVSLLVPTATYTSGKMDWSTFNGTGTSINIGIIPSKTTEIASSDEAETSTVSDIDYTSTSTATVVVTASTRTTTLTLTIGYASSYTKTIPTMTGGPQCTPSTRYITIGAGHSSFLVGNTKPTQTGTPTTVSASPSKTATASTVTTQLNSGVGATGIPGYFNGNGTVNSTASRYTSASMAQPTQTFTGGAVNVLNHNPEVLYAAVAIIGAIVGSVLN